MRPGQKARFQSQAWDTPNTPGYRQPPKPWNFVERPAPQYGNLGPQVNPNSVQPQGIPGGRAPVGYYGNMPGPQGLPQPQQNMFAGYSNNPGPQNIGPALQSQSSAVPEFLARAKEPGMGNPGYGTGNPGYSGNGASKIWGNFKNWQEQNQQQYQTDQAALQAAEDQRGWFGARGMGPRAERFDQQPPPLAAMPPVAAYSSGGTPSNMAGEYTDSLYSDMMGGSQAAPKPYNFSGQQSGSTYGAEAETLAATMPALPVSLASASTNNGPYSAPTSSPVVSDVISNTDAFAGYAPPPVSFQGGMDIGSNSAPTGSGLSSMYDTGAVNPNASADMAADTEAFTNNTGVYDPNYVPPQESWWSKATGDMSVGDWGNTALNVAKGAGALMQGWGAYKDGQRADKMFKEGQKQFQANYNNQVQSNNTYMEDRQRIRHADSGGKQQSVAAYMDKNRLQRYS